MVDFDKELIKKAEKLGLSVDDFEEEDALEDAIDKEQDKLDKKKKELDEDVDHWKSEAKKAFDTRDSIKKDNRRLKKKMKDLEKKLEDSPDMDDLDDLREQFDELKKFKDEKEQEEQEKKLEEADEVEKTTIRFEKEFKDLKKKYENEFNDFNKKIEEREDKLAKSEKEIRNLRKVKLENEIMSSATKYKAYNPKQIVKLVIEDFEYDQDLDKFWHYERNERGKLVEEKTVDERIKDFLGDPDNDNLVEAKIGGGTGHKQDGDRDKNLNKDKDKKKDKDSKYDPKDEKLIAEADEKGLDVEELIRINEVRDLRLSKVGKKED